MNLSKIPRNTRLQNVHLRQIRQSFKHRNSLSGMPLSLLVRKQSRMKIFKTSCRMNTTFSSKSNVGVIAIYRRNGTSLYRSVLWGIAAKENVWKDFLFRTPRRICGTRKIPAVKSSDEFAKEKTLPVKKTRRVTIINVISCEFSILD